MFTNFFKIAIRTFARYSVHTLVNVLGLAVGIAASLIIFLYVRNELVYDQFHKNADRIYRVVVNGKAVESTLDHALTPAPLASAVLKEVNGVEDAVRVARFGAWVITYNDVQYNEDAMIFADPSFFKIFSFGLINGDPDSVLVRPKSIVLSENAAHKYFGTEDPLGKLLMIENDTTFFRVTGIMKNVPATSHMHFDFVASLTTYPEIAMQEVWVTNMFYTYLLAKEDLSMDDLSVQLDALSEKYTRRAYSSLLEENDLLPAAFKLQPLKNIHLRSALQSEFESNGNILYVYLFTSLAIIILIVSCLNFINLSMARASKRAKEISIRKISGSGKRSLIPQFLTESSLLALIAMILGLFITELALPGINRYLGLDLMLSQLLSKWGLILMIVLMAVIGLISGIFPAMYLSSFDPVAMLKPYSYRGRAKDLRRELLLLFQFFIATGAIIMTIIVFRQYHFMINKNLGFETGNMLIIRRPDGLKDKLDFYKNVSLGNPGVQSVTNSTMIPGENSFPKVPFAVEGDSNKSAIAIDYMFISETFASTYGIPVVEGRFFQPGLYSDDTAACVINETARLMLGIDDIAGEALISMGTQNKYKYRIIGVTKDVSFETVDNPVRPLVMILMPGNYEGYLSVRLNTDDKEATIRFLRDEWMKLTTAYPFVSFYLDESLRDNYKPFRETGRIFFIVSITALLVACLGFYSLVSFRYNRNQYEIGIHKLLGAGIKEILLIQLKYLIVLVFIASVFAWAGAYLLAKAWMKDFYDHIFLNPAYFIAASTVLLVILVITSVYQSYSAASVNPGAVLKYE
jgi:putative ABC transport system permease protein